MDVAGGGQDEEEEMARRIQRDRADGNVPVVGNGARRHETVTG